MSTFVRWCRFNMVGAIGMGFQLALLAVLTRLTRWNYLLTTAAAIELTLAHNFVWHLNYTWRDRRGGFALLPQFVRFNASNGAGFDGGKPGLDADAGTRIPSSGSRCQFDCRAGLLVPQLLHWT